MELTQPQKNGHNSMSENKDIINWAFFFNGNPLGNMQPNNFKQFEGFIQ